MGMMATKFSTAAKHEYMVVNGEDDLANECGTVADSDALRAS
ncbi:MAG: hypothetical protein ACREOZ_00260 [Gloeomargaritales cyanobacterium]